MKLQLHKKKRYGFSLLETLASLSLAAILIAGLITGIFMLIKTWDKEARQSSHRLKVARAIGSPKKTYHGTDWEAQVVDENKHATSGADAILQHSCP